MLSVTIVYVDGSAVTAPADHWPALRADGVDRVVVSNAQGAVDFAGHSVYWCRPAGSGYAFGAASFYQNNRGPEIHVTDETQTAVALAPDYVPDLKHAEVKLGAWRAGGKGDKYEGQSWRAFTT